MADKIDFSKVTDTIPLEIKLSAIGSTMGAAAALFSEQSLKDKGITESAKIQEMQLQASAFLTRLTDTFTRRGASIAATAQSHIDFIDGCSIANSIRGEQSTLETPALRPGSHFLTRSFSDLAKGCSDLLRGQHDALNTAIGDIRSKSAAK